MEVNKTLLSDCSAENTKRLFEQMQATDDLIIVNLSLDFEQTVTVCYLDGLTDAKKLEQMLLLLKNNVEMLLPFQKETKVYTIEDAAGYLVQGLTVLLFPEDKYGVAFDTFGVQLRNVEEPASEATVKGPRSGFTESLHNNIALVRFHFPSPKLKVEYLKVGQLSQTSLAILSISGLTNPEIVREVHCRISEIPIDAILESNYIEEWIIDNRFTLFPLIESTERPDRVIGAMLDGRVAVLVQGTPFVLLLPFVFLQAFQVSEDYNWNFYIGSVIRLLRLFSGFLGMLLPALYVATVTYHHELLPTPLLQSIASAREPIPFPAVVESFMMMFAFEIMREAGVRMPKQVGQAVSIVGALILGQAAVQAGIVSPIMVIVAALTGICTFTLPPNATNYVIRILQFGMTFLASLLGYVGIMVGVIMLLTHLASLRSFGIPYLGPAAPFHLNELTDVVVRRPHASNNKRPSLFRPLTRNRFWSKQ
ncbi:spore germination protein [Paenibacillus eucommiae]|uniref:Spore germination protein KA n=1 Tax=Paenibacillus eucommiae TaxID=1355755 RepID=A0ABS4IQY3_9BACL|nr:spore germination protein [Paenibacillus eucommiae]MBP1989945.1 spore germination protein KA [Paenibacillus eucommiae]